MTTRHAAPESRPSPRPQRRLPTRAVPAAPWPSSPPRRPSEPARRPATRRRCSPLRRPGAVDAARPRGDRRQPPPVLQPGDRLADVGGDRRVRRRRVRRVPLADSDGRLRPGRQRRQARRHHATARGPTSGFFYAPSARTWITEYPADALPKAEAVYDAAIYRACARTASSPSTRSARTSAAGCRSATPAAGSSARATARSTTRSARRRAARRRAAWTASRISVDAAQQRQRRHRHRDRRPPIGTNTTGQEAEGPHCITGGGEH